MWNEAVDLFESYMGSGIVVGWFVLSLLYLFLNEKNPSRRILFLYFPTIILLLYFNPLFVRIVYGIIGEEIYYRFLWIAPMSLTIAYVAVCIYAKVQSRLKPVYAGCLVFVIVISGSFIYRNEHFAVAENAYHVPDAVVKICDSIRVEGREVVAAFPKELVQYVRQYDATICMPYGREALVERWGQGNDLLDMLSQQEINVEELVPLTKGYVDGIVFPCNYIIVSEDTVLTGALESHGIVWYANVAGYDIYHDTTFYIGL